MISLREYQIRDVRGIRSAFATGVRSVLHVLPPGGGKTVELAEMVRLATERGKRSVILAHRDILISQASNKLRDAGVPHGIIAPGYRSHKDGVNVASIMTLVRRLKDHEFDFIIVDEAHRSIAKTYKRVFDYYPKARILGVTASPIRTSGQGLNEVFQIMHQGPKFSELIADGFLSNNVTYGPAKTVDLSGVKTTAGDYDLKQLAALIDKPQIIADAVKTYSRICPGVPAIVYCVNVLHAEDVAAAFSDAGYRSVSIHGELPLKIIRERIAGLGDGSVQVLTSCEILSEGVDAPHVICVIGMRPTKSLALHIQQLSRGLRPIFAPDRDLSTRDGRLAAIAAGPKPRAILLDHAANSFRFGLVDEDREWSLEGRKKRKKGDSIAIALRQCPICGMVHRTAPVCPKCGHVYEISTVVPNTVEGELSPIDKIALRRAKWKEVAQARTLDQLKVIAKKRGYLPGWPYHIMRERAAKS